MPGKFELYADKAGEFRFRLKSGNGQNIGQSEGYKTKSAALNGIKSVQTNGANEDSYVFKETKGGKTVFNLRARNNQVILTSQGYATPEGAKSGMKSVIKNAPDAIIVEL